MSYDYLAGVRGDAGLPDQLVPLSQPLIPPHVALVFGIPSFGASAQPAAMPLHAPQPAQMQGLYGAASGQGLLGLPPYGQAAHSQFPSNLAAGALYLQSLAAASQQQQQHQSQQQSAAALAALQAHSAALAATARAGPALSTGLAQSTGDAATSQQPSSRPAPHDAERTTAAPAATTSSMPVSALKAPTYSGATSSYQQQQAQQALLHHMYAAAALSQQHSLYSASPANSYGSALNNPYAHLHAAYYGRPDNGMAAAAAAAAAYGYPSTSAGAYGGYHSAYGTSSGLEYSNLSSGVYRPVAVPATAPAPSANPASQSMGDCDDYADDGSTRAVKRPRLVWTPQLHKKFEVAVTKLGVDKAVPKNIMQEMNIDGLTRENVASHLQKYRMLLKKDGSSVSDGRDSDTRTATTANTSGSNKRTADAMRGVEPLQRHEPSRQLPAAPPVTQAVAVAAGGGTGR